MCATVDRARRILSFTNTGTATRLELTDSVERNLYGIPPDRPLSADYAVGESVLVCDAGQSEVHRILAIDDAARTIDVEALTTPLYQWKPSDPNSAPADVPENPDHFTYPLASLPKYQIGHGGLLLDAARRRGRPARRARPARRRPARQHAVRPLHQRAVLA